MKNNTPDFKRIFKDIISLKFPEKYSKCKKILSKENLTALDILHLNKIIFGNAHLKKTKNAYRSYQVNDILMILDYQKKNNLNNQHLAKHFELSRNTIAKWKKRFLI